MAWARRTLLSILIVAAAGGVLLWAFRSRPVAVETAIISEGVFRNTVEEDGRTRVRQRYVVSAPVAGRVLRVLVKAGDAVAAGSTLATILPNLPALLDPRTRRELEEKSERRKLQSKRRTPGSSVPAPLSGNRKPMSNASGRCAKEGSPLPSSTNVRNWPSPRTSAIHGRRSFESMRPSMSSIRPGRCFTAMTSRTQTSA